MVDVTPKHIKAGLKGQQPLLDAPLYKKVKTGDDHFTWTLDDAPGGKGKHLTLFLTKESGMEWWSCVAEGEPTIDVTAIEPENSKLSDLDAETARTVSKMMFDTRQKQMGLPTSDELQKRQMLEKFMKAHPEMDFSKAKIC